eukprot:gene52-56_t
MSEDILKKEHDRVFSKFFTREGSSNNRSKRKGAKCKLCDETFACSLATNRTFVKHLLTCPGISSSKPQQNTLNTFIGRTLTRDESIEANKYLARWYTTAAVPLVAIENEWFERSLNIICPSYKLMCRKTLSNVLIPKEFDTVMNLIKARIGESQMLSIIFDGWTDITGKSIYAVVVAFEDGSEQLYSYFDASNESHTAEYLENKFYQYIEKISAVVSDNAANMKLARSLLVQRDDCRHILKIRCFMHAFGVTMGSVMGHPSIKAVITLCQKIVTFVRASHLTLANLTKRAKESKPPINTGLKSSNTTRLTSTFLCISSVLEHKRVLISMLHAQEIPSPVVSKIIMDGAFWTRLSDIYHLLKPFSDVIMSIQSNESSLADVARYWIYLTRSICSFLGASTFDDSVKAHIQFAFNKRTVEIPPVISLLALYLDPRFRGAFSVSEDVLKLISIEAAIIMFKRRLYSEEDLEVW